MYLRPAASLALLPWVAVTLAQLTKDLPSCALSCFDAYPGPPTTASSPACTILPGSNFEDTFSPCFYSACPVLDALSAMNVTSVICEQPARDISWAIRGFVIASTTVASGVIGLRVLYKLRGLAGGIGWDDYTIVISVIVILVAAIGQFMGGWYGLGRDQWKVHPENVTKVYKCFYIAAVGYKLGNAATRASLLCFYLRIFGGETRARFMVLAFIALTVIIGVTFALADALQCRPAYSFWDGWDGELSGSCRSLSAISWAHSIFNIILDAATLGIAFYMVHKLHMRRRRKWAVVGMLSLGSAITIVSIVRLQSLPALSNTRNRTWNLAPVSYWSAIEMFFGMVCACLPALKKLSDSCCGAREGTGSYVISNSDRHRPTPQGGSGSGHDRQRPVRKKSLDPTLTFSENEDFGRSQAGGIAGVGSASDTELGVLPAARARSEKDSVKSESKPVPWDALEGGHQKSYRV